jgi:dUTP pyrophosphatase
MQIEVLRIEPDAFFPTRSHDSDAGLDLYAYEEFRLWDQSRAFVRTGIAVNIPHGYVGLIWPRSGLAAKSIDTLAGVIDAGYQGEILVNLINHSQGGYMSFDRGDRIAQLLVQRVELPTLVEVEAFANNSHRGGNGHGSTGS